MAGSQISTSVTILDSLHGFQAVSLTEYSTSAACSIAAGSVVEIAGAFFTFSGDEAIEASTWTSIVTGNTAYITLTASGTAGSQVVVAAYTSTAPTWRDDFQGWYASAASSVRVIGSVYKAEATNYAQKYLYNSMQDQKQKTVSVLNASVASTLNVYGILNVSGIKLNGYYTNTAALATTFSVLNALLLPFTPATNDTIIIDGSIRSGSSTYIVPLYAIRNSATSMTIYGYDPVSVYPATSLVCTGATAIWDCAVRY